MAMLLEYPECFLAACLGLLVCLRSWQKQEWRFPERLAAVALSFAEFLPQSYLRNLQKWLFYAGFRTRQSFANFCGAKFYLALSALLFSFVAPLPAVVLGLLFAWFLPDLLVFLYAKRRQQEIRDSLPQALDLMVLCVDAGLGLDATLQRISSESSIASALNSELNILGREILFGVDRERAYKDLYTRNGVDELKTLGSALTQANKLGLSVAKILRNQSDFIRKKAAQRAEEKALKMPILMAFPLWFCIMPSLLLLVLGPSLIRFYYSFRAVNNW
jgi:tight adherence protein C